MMGLWLIDRLGRRTLLYVGSVGYIVSLGTIAFLFIQNDAAFRISSSAIAVREAFDQLSTATASSVADEKRQSLQQKATAAIEALNATLSQAEFQGDKTSLPTDSTLAQVQTRIEELMAQATDQAGSSGRWVLLGIFLFIAAHAVGQGTVIWVLISEVFPNEFRAAGQTLGSATHWIFAAALTLVFPLLVSQFSPGYVFGFFCFMMILQLIWVATMVPETKGVPLEELQEQLGL
jgi:MFS family permease